MLKALAAAAGTSLLPDRGITAESAPDYLRAAQRRVRGRVVDHAARRPGERGLAPRHETPAAAARLARGWDQPTRVEELPPAPDRLHPLHQQVEVLRHVHEVQPLAVHDEERAVAVVVEVARVGSEMARR